jgi:hypothetical protein
LAEFEVKLECGPASVRAVHARSGRVVPAAEKSDLALAHQGARRPALLDVRLNLDATAKRPVHVVKLRAVSRLPHDLQKVH